MDIGEIKETRIVEPLENPVPAERPAEVERPAELPEKVPA